jgi:hypothetical protein
MIFVLVSFSDRFGIGLGSFWDRFGIVRGSFWGRCGIVLGSFSGRLGILLGSCWLVLNRSGVVLGAFLVSCWDRFGIVLGFFGIVLDSVWGRVGVVLGQSCNSKSNYFRGQSCSNDVAQSCTNDVAIRNASIIWEERWWKLHTHKCLGVKFFENKNWEQNKTNWENPWEHEKIEKTKLGKLKNETN